MSKNTAKAKKETPAEEQARKQHKTSVISKQGMPIVRKILPDDKPEELTDAGPTRRK